MQTDLSAIVWPSRPGLRDHAEWKRNLGIVRMLTENCRVVEWLRGEPGKGGYEYFPYKFEFNSTPGTIIEFLPHWGYYSIEGIMLEIPSDWEWDKLFRAFEAVQMLKCLGMRKRDK